MLDNDLPIPKPYIKDTPEVKDIARHLKQENCMILSSKTKEEIDRESQKIIVKARKAFRKQMERDETMTPTQNSPVTKKKKVTKPPAETEKKTGRKKDNKISAKEENKN